MGFPGGAEIVGGRRIAEADETRSYLKEQSILVITDTGFRSKQSNDCPAAGLRKYLVEIGEIDIKF